MRHTQIKFFTMSLFHFISSFLLILCCTIAQEHILNHYLKLYVLLLLQLIALGS